MGKPTEPPPGFWGPSHCPPPPAHPPPPPPAAVPIPTWHSHPQQVWYTSPIVKPTYEYDGAGRPRVKAPYRVFMQSTLKLPGLRDSELCHWLLPHLGPLVGADRDGYGN